MPVIENVSFDPVQPVSLQLPKTPSEKTLLAPEYRPKKFNADLDTKQVTMLDLSQLSSGLTESYFNGVIPEWVREFKNLRVLKAVNLGVLYLEEWLLDLSELRELYLDDNMITTWPYFLLRHHALEHVSLAGNPCVEQQVVKSPTFKNFYLGYTSNYSSQKFMPQNIRGPEWLPASNLRSRMLANLQGMGFYAGGLYTVQTPPDLTNDGYITCTEPLPLQQRRERILYKHEDPESARSEYICSRDNSQRNSTLQADKVADDKLSVISAKLATINKAASDHLSSFEGSMGSDISWLAKPKTNMFEEQPDFGVASTNPDIKLAISKTKRNQSKITREVFDDIVHLQKRMQYKFDAIPYKYIPLVGNKHSSYNQLPIKKGTVLTSEQQTTLAMQLKEDEERYVACLGKFSKKFFQKRHKNNAMNRNIQRALDFIPELYAAHDKYVYPAIHGFARTLNSENKALCANSLKFLCVHLNGLKSIYQRIANQLCESEHMLHSSASLMSLYKDEDLGAKIKHKVHKIKDIGSYIPKVGNKNQKLEIPVYKNYENEDFGDHEDGASFHVSRLSFVGKHMSKFKEKVNSRKYTDGKNPLEYLYLPLIRLVQYERLFTAFYTVDPKFSELVKILRILRKNIAMLLQSSRQMRRSNLLETKFKFSPGSLVKYQWDVLLAVQSRTYLEPGIVKYKSNDVFDEVLKRPMSLVKEIFSVERPRYLRLITCEDTIYLLDEILENVICELDRKDIIPIPLDPAQTVRIIFPKVAETCIAKVMDFSAAYLTSDNYREEFINALRTVNTLLS